MSFALSAYQSSCATSMAVLKVRKRERVEERSPSASTYSKQCALSTLTIIARIWMSTMRGQAVLSPALTASKGWRQAQ